MHFKKSSFRIFRCIFPICKTPKLHSPFSTCHISQCVFRGPAETILGILPVGLWFAHVGSRPKTDQDKKRCGQRLLFVANASSWVGANGRSMVKKSNSNVYFLHRFAKWTPNQKWRFWWSQRSDRIWASALGALESATLRCATVPEVHHDFKSGKRFQSSTQRDFLSEGRAKGKRVYLMCIYNIIYIICIVTCMCMCVYILYIFIHNL